MCVGLVAVFVIALFIAVTISRRKRKGKLCHVNSITAEENHTYILKLQCIENKKLGFHQNLYMLLQSQLYTCTL